MATVNFTVVFFTGLLVGIAPCILLMLSVFGTSLILIEDKRKFIEISIGLILGMIIMYIIISIIFINIRLLLQNIYSFIGYFFAGILILIGIWQIIECREEKSKIFGTPQKIKLVLKDFITRNSGIYAFLVGTIFVLIKIPCFGGIYILLLESIFQNPLLYVYIVVYLIGMMIPTIMILVLIRLGLESSKIDSFRLKYRTPLRILNGVILIFLALYLIIFP